MSIATTRRLPARACGYARAVSPRVRARVLVGLAAAASAALVVGVTVLQAEDGGSSEPRAPQAERRPPPLELGLLVRDDREARALREAEALLNEGEREKLGYGIALQRVGRPHAAREAFAEASAADPASLPAKVAAALGRFDKDDPSQAFSRLGPLARADEDGVVRYHLGLALSWMGQVEEATRQLELAREADPDGFYGREAG